MPMSRKLENYPEHIIMNLEGKEKLISKLRKLEMMPRQDWMLPKISAMLS